jgi:hypothetical protein
MSGASREHHYVYALRRRSNFNAKFWLAVVGFVLVLADEGLLDVLADVLLRGISDVAASEEVFDLALGHRTSGNSHRHDGSDW